MAMGTESKVVIDNEMQKAKENCQTFRTQVKTFVEQLDTTVSTLLSTGFKGEAADGFKVFYDKNIKAFFNDEGTFDQYLGRFDKVGEGLFDTIERQLTGEGGLDPSLGENNKNIGQSSDGQGAQ